MSEALVPVDKQHLDLRGQTLTDATTDPPPHIFAGFPEISCKINGSKIMLAVPAEAAPCWLLPGEAAAGATEAGAEAGASPPAEAAAGKNGAAKLRATARTAASSKARASPRSIARAIAPVAGPNILEWDVGETSSQYLPGLFPQPLLAMIAHHTAQCHGKLRVYTAFTRHVGGL